MNPYRWWQVVLALIVGSSIGLGVRRGLVAVFGHTGSAISVSTVTVSSLLGGFLGATIGWVMSRAMFSADAQNLLLFGFLGVMASVAAGAAAAQMAMAPADGARLRRRTLIHIGIGIASALLGIALVQGVLYLFSS
jgi:fluoride ion exporter CrcB/FEX